MNKKEKKRSPKKKGLDCDNGRYSAKEDIRIVGSSNDVSDEKS